MALFGVEELTWTAVCGDSHNIQSATQSLYGREARKPLLFSGG
jgi:hypothetical protein